MKREFVIMNEKCEFLNKRMTHIDCFWDKSMQHIQVFKTADKAVEFIEPFGDLNPVIPYSKKMYVCYLEPRKMYTKNMEGK